MSARRGTRFGATELSDELQVALHKARRLEWISLAYLASAIVLLYLVMGSSQAMKAAWLEDMLAVVPPIAFLVAARVARALPDRAYPYGRHRAVAVGHLVSGLALLAMGLFLVFDSGMALVLAEHPPIGTMRIFGHTIWAGWLMILVMVYTLVVPVILGRLKLPLAEQLHDKVLHADADMNKADWMTAAGAIVGVLGIGVGLWWMDSAMALFIAGSILKDGVTNVRGALADLMDKLVRTVDNKAEHPLVRQIDGYLDSRPWIAQHRCRVRDMGHVFQVEVRVVPRDGVVDLVRLHQVTQDVQAMDWKLDDVTVTPVLRIDEGETQGEPD